MQRVHLPQKYLKYKIIFDMLVASYSTQANMRFHINLLSVHEEYSFES